MKLKPETLIPRLGDHLLKKKLITEDNLRAALARQHAAGQGVGTRPLLGQILVEMGFIEKDALDAAITEQILAMHRALEEINNNLEKTVEERTSSLARALEKLAELNKMQNRFVANISHELRTPLYHISGNLELLLDEDMGVLNADQRQALSVVYKASGRLSDLIEDLILFTATNDRPLKLRRQAVSVSTVSAEAMTDIEDMAGKAGISVNFDSPRNDVSILADPGRLRWVIRHLLENAVKYNKNNGLITLRIREEGSHIAFTVEDTGIGIPQESYEEIFEPFHQLDETLSRRYSGMGLGLTLARKIIQAHGTDISVSSEVGKGTSFSFRLEKAG